MPFFGDTEAHSKAKSNDAISDEIYLQLRRLCVEGDIEKCRDFLQTNAKVDNIFSIALFDKTPYSSRTPLEIALSLKNVPLCKLLIEYGAHQGKVGHTRYQSGTSYLELSLDLPEVFDILLNECTESDIALKTLYALVPRQDIPNIKKIMEKYDHYVTSGKWADTWKTNSEVINECFRKQMIELLHYFIDLGFTMTKVDSIQVCVENKNEAAIQTLLSTALIHQFNQVDMQKIFNFILRGGYVSMAETVRQAMIQKGYTVVVDLRDDDNEVCLKPLLMKVPLPRLYDVVNYAVQHCKTFNLIKDAYYKVCGDNKYLPETVLSYLAFVKQFDAMKLIIENPNCSFEPSHLVACSLFRGHYTSRFFKLSLPIYDEIFEYLMRDDIRSRVLGVDREWVDKSIFVAIRYGNEKMVKKLVELGADLTNIFIASYNCGERSTYARYSLLSYACEYQPVSLIQFLVEKGLPVEGTMIDALNEPMMSNMSKKKNDESNSDSENDNEEGDVDADEKDEDSESDMTSKFFFSLSEFDDIDDSLFPKYFDRASINKNRDIDSLRQFGYDEFDSECVYLLNMTPLGVAIYKRKADVVKFLLLNGANPMSRSMTNFPAYFCLSYSFIERAIEDNGATAEDTDEEVINRYPFSEEFRAHHELSISGDEAPGTHSTTSIHTTNILELLKEYPHQLECELHKHNRVKRQRGCNLGEFENENRDKITKIDNIDVNSAAYIPFISNVDGDTVMEKTNTLPSQTPTFVYRDNAAEIFQILTEYGVPTQYNSNKLGISIPNEHSYRPNEGFTPKELLESSFSEPYPANLIIYFAKNNFISLKEFDEVINGCFEKALSYYESNIEKALNVCEVLSAIINPMSISTSTSTSTAISVSASATETPSTFDQKVALMSGILDPVYRDRLYDVVIHKLYRSDEGIEVFMKLIKAYPTFFSLNMQHSSGKSLLDGNSAVISSQLIQLGLDVNQHTLLGDSLLLHEIKQANTKMIHHLVAFGADTTAIDCNGDSFEEVTQKSNCPQLTKDFIKKCTHVLKLLGIMNQYQSMRCICVEEDDNECTSSPLETTVQTFQPFSREDYELLASSCIPEYTFETLSYFFSSCSTDPTTALAPAECFSCKHTLTKNDHCRPYQTSSPDQNGFTTTTYIHDQCFFKDFQAMADKCITQSIESGYPKYIRNPTKSYDILKIK